MDAVVALAAGLDTAESGIVTAEAAMNAATFALYDPSAKERAIVLAG